MNTPRHAGESWHLVPQGLSLAARDPSLRWGDGGEFGGQV